MKGTKMMDTVMAHYGISAEEYGALLTNKKQSMYNLTPKRLSRIRELERGSARVSRSNARGAKRRALKKAQTPPWYCHATVTEIYETAAEFGMHVDHIVPLSKGGLHSHENLQLLTPEENQAKSDSDCWIDW